LRQHSNYVGFLGQLQSSMGERIEVRLNYLQIEFRVVDASGQPVKRMMDGLSFGIDEIDNLQGLLLNARVRVGSQL
jgi:hypothetical protein